MAHAQKSDFVFRRNGRVHLNRRGRQFRRLPAAEFCAVAFIVGSNAGYTMFRGSVKATLSIRQFPLHFPSRASPCAITFQLDSILLFAWTQVCVGVLFAHHGTPNLKNLLSYFNTARSKKFRIVTVCKDRLCRYWIWLRGLQLILAVVCYDESRFYRVVYWLLGSSPTYEFYKPTFRNTIGSIFIGG
jgi:hypothetical protein